MTNKYANEELTAEELAKVFGVSEFTIKILAKSGELPSVRRGNTSLFSVPAVITACKHLWEAAA
jgi:excisionase family DNA binding protein